MADHLTSAGGKLVNGKQMSALRWLEAGATGSFGTVVEPCNFPHKFPNPVVAMEHYLNGVGWTGDIQEVLKIWDRVEAFCDRITVCLDVL